MLLYLIFDILFDVRAFSTILNGIGMGTLLINPLLKSLVHGFDQAQSSETTIRKLVVTRIKGAFFFPLNDRIDCLFP